jgi:tetratricopeptide (TPR) repeat protein
MHMKRILLAPLAAALLGMATGCAPSMSEPVLMMNRSAEADAKGQYAEAERLARDALERDPTLANAEYDLGLALKHQGRYDEALQHIQAALGLFPAENEADVAKCLYAVSLIHEAAANKQAAVDGWRKYIDFARQHESQAVTLPIAEQRLAQLEQPATAAVPPGTPTTVRPAPAPPAPPPPPAPAALQPEPPGSGPAPVPPPSPPAPPGRTTPGPTTPPVPVPAPPPTPPAPPAGPYE